MYASGNMPLLSPRSRNIPTVTTPEQSRRGLSYLWGRAAELAEGVAVVGSGGGMDQDWNWKSAVEGGGGAVVALPVVDEEVLGVPALL
jgi:hypothetical protein